MMKEYPVSEAGCLLIDEETALEILRTAADAQIIDSNDIDITDPIRCLYEHIEYQNDDSPIVFHTEFSGEAYDIEAPSDGAEEYDDDTILYLPAKKTPSLFEKAYESKAEIEKEFRETLSPWLPDSVRISHRIKNLIGIYIA